MYRGDIRLGDTIDLKFCTVSTTGAPTTLAGSPVISAYPANSTTQLTAGITLSVDFDAVTGLHNVRVVATSGNGYATATNYELVITTGTVGGTSVVGYVVGAFSIENRSAVMPATAGRTLVVDAAGLADATVVKVGPTGSGTAQTARDIGASVLLSTGTGTGQLDFTSGVVKANLAQILGTALTETAGLLAGAFKKFFNVATPTGTVNSIPDAVAGAASGLAIVGSNMGTASSVTGAVGSVTGAVGSVTGAVGSVTGAVGSVASGGITRASLAADTGLQTIRSNTAQAGAAGTITLDASANATDSFYTDCWIVLTGGTGAGQARRISAYVGATKVASIAPNWITNPDNTSTFAVLPRGQVNVNANQDKTGYAVGTAGIAAAAFATDAIDANALKADAANEIRDAVWAQAMTELAAVPGVTGSVLQALEWVFLLSRNKVEQTATTQTLRKDDGSTSLAASTHSDDGTTHTRGKFA